MTARDAAGREQRRRPPPRAPGRTGGASGSPPTDGDASAGHARGMTTTTPAAPARSISAAGERGSTSGLGRHAVAATVAGPARLAGAALLAVLALTVPAAGVLAAVGPSASSLDVAASFLLVAALDVVVARGLYVLARGRAYPAAYAALLSRVGHGILLAIAAVLLASRGTAGLDGFRGDWSTALLVLAAHLCVAGVALWRARLVPRTVSAAVAGGGAASLVLAGVTAGEDVLLPVLVPLLVAEGVLACALLRCGLRPTT
jgi:hypothetical protein